MWHAHSAPSVACLSGTLTTHPLSVACVLKVRRRESHRHCDVNNWNRRRTRQRVSVCVAFERSHARVVSVLTLPTHILVCTHNRSSAALAHPPTHTLIPRSPFLFSPPATKQQTHQRKMQPFALKHTAHSTHAMYPLDPHHAVPTGCCGEFAARSWRQITSRTSSTR